MKAAIIRISSYHFAFRSVSKASRLLELLGDGVQVEQEYDDAARQYRYEVSSPDDDRRMMSIQMELVDASVIHAPLKRVPKGKRLGFTPPLDPAS